MRNLVLGLALALVACGDSGAPEAPALTSTETPVAFEPTAFHVDVHGTGRPVILIPGLGCPGDVWADTVAHLDGYQTHVLTLAGFAGQPRIDGRLAAATREQLAHYIRDRHLTSPIVIGHSMGGFIAYWLAETEPDLVGPTIVIDSGASLGDGDRESNAATGAQVRDMWKGASDDQFAQQVHDIFGQMAAKPERLAPLLPQIGRTDRAALGDAIYELFTTDLRADLGHIRAPVLVVLSDGSLQDGYRHAADPVPDHKVVVVPNTGHFLFLDDPAGFYGAVDGFLTSHAPVARL